MKESAAVAEVTTGKRLNDYYRWVEPDSHITVCLNPETADRLQRNAIRGTELPSKARAEVGGILLGRKEREAGRTLVIVDDFEPVACEHRSGLSYAFTAEDAPLFEAALGQHAGRRTLSAVGYYRSHYRDGLFLSGDDLRLIQCHFRGPDNVFLLLKPLANKACTAGFFFWKDGHIQAEFTDSEVPLIPVALSAGGGVPVALPAFVSLESGRGPRRLLIPALVGAGVAAALAFAAVRYEGTRSAGGPTPPAPQTVPAAVLTSAPSAPDAVQTPVRAVAARSVGTSAIRPESVPGKILNEPSAASGDDAKPAGPLPTPMATEATMATRSPIAGEPATPPAAKPLAVATERPVDTAAPSPERLAAPVEASRPVEAPRTDAATRAVPLVSAPAPITSSSPAAQTFIAPRVIHQVAPAVPRGVGTMITTDVQVDVAVWIDVFGKVTDARVAATRGAAAGLLTIEALKAAQLFRFQPARENGRDVAASMTLTFRFAGTAR